jgi:hypothetical protein
VMLIPNIRSDSQNHVWKSSPHNSTTPAHALKSPCMYYHDTKSLRERVSDWTQNSSDAMCPLMLIFLPSLSKRLIQEYLCRWKNLLYCHDVNYVLVTWHTMTSVKTGWPTGIKDSNGRHICLHLWYHSVLTW